MHLSAPCFVSAVLRRLCLEWHRALPIGLFLALAGHIATRRVSGIEVVVERFQAGSIA